MAMARKATPARAASTKRGAARGASKRRKGDDQKGDGQKGDGKKGDGQKDDDQKGDGKQGDGSKGAGDRHKGAGEQALPPPPPPPGQPPSVATGTLPNGTAAGAATGTLPNGAPGSASDGVATGTLPKGTPSERTGGGLVCHMCQEEGMMSSQLLLLEEHCWQGRLHCVCLKCSEMDENDFRSMAKKNWKKRSHNAKQLARVQGYQQGMLEIDREKDESVRAWKRRVFVASMTLASAVYTAFQRASAKQQKEILVAFDAFEEERLKVVADATYQPGLMSCKNLFDDSVAQYLSEIMEGLDEFYLCRKRGCGFFALAHCWVNNSEIDGQGQHRCPMCTQYYRPWSGEGDVITANKVLVVQGGANDAHGPALLGGVHTGIKAGEVTLYPIIWQETRAQALTNRLKEICNEVKECSPAEAMKMCQEIATVKAQNKSYFKEMVISNGVIDQLDWFNLPPCKKPWLYEHLKKPFLHGKCVVEDETTVLSQEQTLKMWAASRAAIMSARTTL